MSENPMPQDYYREAYEFLTNTKELDLNSLNERERLLLDDIQGGILRGHERTFSLFLFLDFDYTQEKEIKRWIANFAENVTLALKQEEQNKSLSQVGKNKNSSDEIVKSCLFINFFLSFKGYQALGLKPEDNFTKLKQLLVNEYFLKGHSFEKGMKEEGADLQGDLGNWEREYTSSKIKALILLADDNFDNLYRETNKIIKSMPKSIKITKKEAGIIRKNNRNQTIESFGFPDGISQPLFTKQDIDKARERDKVGEDWNWDPRANLRLILNIDPYGKQFEDETTGNKYGYGSFLVYRKLEQNVDGFNNKIREFACNLEGKENNERPQEETEELVRAFIIGRFRKDGRPVALYQTSEGEVDFNQNNFNYGVGKEFKAISGNKCPFPAHIRKVNPRGISNKVHGKDYPKKPDVQRQARIVRRGVTYGLPDEKNALLLSSKTQQDLEIYQAMSKNLGINLDEGKEGLLFLCFQSDINAQFETLSQWANDRNFGPNQDGGFGVDPIVGQGKDRDKAQKWPKKWGAKDKEQFGFSGFVTPRGGEYFFAPSLSFLKSLKEL